MGSDTMSERSGPFAATAEPLPEALTALLARRRLSLAGLGALLRAEGVAISRTRLHQLATGTGSPPTGDQIERLAGVLGVNPGHFAEYRLLRVRALLDPAVVGFDRAMANLDRLRGRRDPARPEDVAAAEPRYPGAVSPSKERA